MSVLLLFGKEFDNNLEKKQSLQIERKPARL